MRRERKTMRRCGECGLRVRSEDDAEHLKGIHHRMRVRALAEAARTTAKSTMKGRRAL